MFLVGRAKQFSGEIETKYVACAALKRPATSHNSVHNQENIIGRIALAHDHLVAAVTDRTAPK
jgi:hypothetical protein